MLDLHTHVLWGLDDGSKDQGMTLDMLKIAKAQGIKGLAMTPHFIYGSHQEMMAVYEERLKALEEIVEKEKLGLALYKGHEVYLDEFSQKALEEGLIYTLNGTSYVLVELSFSALGPYVTNYIEGLLEKGYRPILAHPERYLYIEKEWPNFEGWLEKGVLMQVNSGSLLGLYGQAAKSMAHQLIRNNKVHLVASDAHSSGKRKPNLKAAYDLLEDLYDPSLAALLLKENPQRVIAGDDVLQPAYTWPEEKVTWWHKIKSRFK